MAKEPKDQKGKVVIKKVRAYPIPASVEFKGIKKPVEIMKLAGIGFWASLGKTLVQVGVTYNVEFELPVLHAQVICPARVLRTMDKVHDAGGAEKRVERLAEFQFIKPSDENMDKIRKFLHAIGQPL